MGTKAYVSVPLGATTENGINSTLRQNYLFTNFELKLVRRGVK